MATNDESVEDGAGSLADNSSKQQTQHAAANAPTTLVSTTSSTDPTNAKPTQSSTIIASSATSNNSLPSAEINDPNKSNITIDEDLPLPELPGYNNPDGVQPDIKPLDDMGNDWFAAFIFALKAAGGGARLLAKGIDYEIRKTSEISKDAARVKYESAAIIFEYAEGDPKKIASMASIDWEKEREKPPLKDMTHQQQQQYIQKHKAAQEVLHKEFKNPNFSGIFKATPKMLKLVEKYGLNDPEQRKKWVEDFDNTKEKKAEEETNHIFSDEGEKFSREIEEAEKEKAEKTGTEKTTGVPESEKQQTPPTQNITQKEQTKHLQQAEATLKKGSETIPPKNREQSPMTVAFNNFKKKAQKFSLRQLCPKPQPTGSQVVPDPNDKTKTSRLS